MAAGRWCLLSFPSIILLPSSPPKMTPGSQHGVSITQRGLNYHQKVQKSQRAGSWLASCSALRSPPSSLNKCRDKSSLVNVLCCSHHYAVCPRSSETLGLVFMDKKMRLGPAATRQQRQQQFGKEDAVRRLLQFPSRNTELWGNFCKATWDETSADVLSTFPTRENSMPTLDCSLLSPARLNSYQSGKLKFWIVTVSTSDELLAAATLRAQLFYSYPKFPPSGSEGLEGIKARLKRDFEVQDLFKSRVKSEFERDTKMQDLNMNVKCLLAVCEESEQDELLVASNGKRNSLVSPPTVDSSAFSRKPLVAIGTLDIQVSENGPGHRLLSFSSQQKLHVSHGYIFNLCVAQTARRHGVATALMKEAVHLAQQIGLRVLYVHVEANNGSALALYQKLGYVVEEEESFDVEQRFQRPRRILLSYSSP